MPPNPTVAPICPGSCREVLLVADAPTENHSQMAPTHPTSDESALSFSKAFSRPSFPRFSVPPTQGGAFQVHQGGACQVDQGGAHSKTRPLETWVCQYTCSSMRTSYELSCFLFSCFLLHKHCSTHRLSNVFAHNCFLSLNVPCQICDECNIWHIYM